jgi:hypothetical protein
MCCETAHCRERVRRFGGTGGGDEESERVTASWVWASEEARIPNSARGDAHYRARLRQERRRESAAGLPGMRVRARGGVTLTAALAASPELSPLTVALGELIARGP